MESKKKFENVDLVHLKHLKEMIRDNLILKDMECVDVSKVYHVFQWVESLEEKVKDHFEMLESIEDLKREKSEVIYELRQKEIELEEAKKPKRKPRAKKKAPAKK
jgi:ERCC4-type nuclease